MKTFFRTIWIFIPVFLTIQLSAKSQVKPDTTLVFSFSQLPQSLYFKATGQFPKTLASVYLPKDYTSEKKFPFILWIDGGMGGAGDLASQAKEKFGDTGFIIANVPLFIDSLEALKPDSSNFWNRLNIAPHDAAISWNAYQVMLDQMIRLIPNIDLKNSFMGGFSNGGHVTALILNQSSASSLSKYFNKFYFIEGGRGLENFDVLKGKPVMYMQGGNRRDWIRPIYQNALNHGANATFMIMEGAGHEFPAKYQNELRKWFLQNLE